MSYIRVVCTVKSNGTAWRGSGSAGSHRERAEPFERRENRRRVMASVNKAQQQLCIINNSNRFSCEVITTATAAVLVNRVVFRRADAQQQQLQR